MLQLDRLPIRLGDVHILREAKTSQIPCMRQTSEEQCCEVAALQGIRNVVVLRNMWTVDVFEDMRCFALICPLLTKP